MIGEHRRLIYSEATRGGHSQPVFDEVTSEGPAEYATSVSRGEDKMVCKIENGVLCG